VIDESVSGTAIAEAVREGLQACPKALPPWLFYDETGSALFEQITALPEYYLTGMERELLRRHAREIVERMHDTRPLSMVELGAGSAQKTAVLLRAAQAEGRRITYLPMEISATALSKAKAQLAEEFPELCLRPVLTDFTREKPTLPIDAQDQRMLLWLGSSAGNFEMEEAVRILRDASAEMREGDFLLLGLDGAPEANGSAKSKRISDVLLAYDDAAGITAAFNRNVLTRIGRELGAEFRLDQFEHEARWNSHTSCVEMHLVSTVAQSVFVRELETSFHFNAGESIHTENSRKYTLEEGSALVRAAGFSMVNTWLDPDGWYGLFLGRRG
jgi:dimethylhistidine N-methyltransferase